MTIHKHYWGVISTFVLFNNFQEALAVTHGAQSVAQEQHLAKKILDDHIKAFPSEASDESVSSRKRIERDVRPPKLTEKTKREVVFNHIFAKSQRYNLLKQEMAPILNAYAWGDLHLFCGTTSVPGHHLLSRVNRTVTMLGEGMLATFLATPTSNIGELTKRQHMIQAFLNSTTEANQIKASLRRYQEAEQSIFSLWTSTDPLYTKEYKKYMNRRFYVKNGKKANKNAGLLELRKRFFRDFLGITYNFLWPVTYPTVSELFLGRDMNGPIFSYSGSPTVRRFLWTGAIPYYGGWYKLNTFKKVSTYLGKSTDNLSVLSVILVESFYTWTAYRGIRNYMEYSSVLRSLALRMADVQTLVLAAAEISACVASSPTLEALYGVRLARMRNLLAQSQEDTELGQLVKYLQTLPYKQWSYFFNNAGKLLASHTLFTEYKDAFVDTMYELGELDVFVSMATLMQEAQYSGDSHAYVFAKFMDRNQRSKPYVKLEGMWNPFLDADVAVANSVVMDAAGGTSNIILTGPNAGGKSTFLTGVTTSLLLSQTFGISPAKEAVLTPFDKINTSIDITDDIAAGKSLFMAEVDRAQEHLNMLSELRQNEFSFSIFDEPFSGTNPTEGAAAEYSILEAMADYRNTLNIVATHYPIVMLLAKNRPELGFANYKVYITYQGEEKKLNYTYKVIPGQSNQAIAIDILAEQGYDVKFLKRAREIIKHPERYQSQF